MTDVEMSIRGFLEEFRRIHEEVEDQQFCFVLGAGASRSSGIRTGAELARAWLRELHQQDVASDILGFEAWLAQTKGGIEALNPSDPASSYSDIYERRFRSNPESGFSYLIKEMRDAEPGFGYSVLALILARERHKAVITTNFDNLVEQALALYTRTLPVVLSHEASAGSLNRKLIRPVIVKIHRDLMVDPMSRASETAKLAQAYRDALTSILQRHIPIFIGYGGNDGSLMGLLEESPETLFQRGLWWCYRKADGPPSERILSLARKRHGHVVAIAGFDELMVSLNDILKYPLLDRDIVERAEQRAKRYRDQASSFRGAPKQADAVKAADPSAKDPAASVATLSLISTIKRQADAELRSWQWHELALSEPDREKRAEIFARARAALQGNPDDLVEIIRWEGDYLYEQENDVKGAKEKYEQALALAPDDPYTLNQLGNLLKLALRNFAEAERHYRRAAHELPDDADILGNVANVMVERNAPRAEVEAAFHEALKADPDHANNLGNFAGYLLARGARDEGLRMLARAIAAVEDPESSQALRCEVWFYAYAHSTERDRALLRLRGLIDAGARSPGWDFSKNIDRALKDNHPEAAWVPALANVVSDAAPPSALATWPAWAAAAPPAPVTP